MVAWLNRNIALLIAVAVAIALIQLLNSVHFDWRAVARAAEAGYDLATEYAIVFVWIAAAFWGVVFIGLIHETRSNRRSRSKKGGLLVDILDRLTNRKALEARLADAAEPLIVDAEALAAAMKAKVIGQDAVCDDVAAQIRWRSAMARRARPLGVFLFAGAPGTGKTYLAKCLAESLERKLIHIDMSQLGRGTSAGTMLFGSTKGYIGSESYGSLTGALRDTPDAIVLLDEFEKAHVDVHKNFLTAWNDGFLTEASDGRPIATNRAVFILTTNAATAQLGDIVARNGDDETIRRESVGALRDARFAPEVLSRIDRIFVFRQLKGLDIARVAALEIEAIVKNYDLEIADGGIDPEILLESVDRLQKLEGVGSARDLARGIEERLSEALISAKIKRVKRVRLWFQNGEPHVEPVADTPTETKPQKK